MIFSFGVDAEDDKAATEATATTRAPGTRRDKDPKMLSGSLNPSRKP